MDDIEDGARETRPPKDSAFADKTARLIQPEPLKRQEPWLWSAGIGTDVWAMFCACITGDLETVKHLVATDPSLVRAHYEYRTPISFAVRENQLAVVDFLLDQGAEQLHLGNVLEIARDRDYTQMVALLERKVAALYNASAEGEPVAAAIRDRDRTRVRQLLDESPDRLHAGDARSNQPIHWAVMTRQIPIIDELLTRGADINAPRADGARPIQLTNGDYYYRGWRDVPEGVATTPNEIYRHLVAQGAFVDIGMAAFKGDLARVRALLAGDPSLANRVDVYNSYYAGCGAPLKNAALGGHLEIVNLLLDYGADPNLPEEGIAPRGHALYSAVAHGHYEIAQLLLKRGAYSNPPVESSADAVSRAIGRGDVRTIELLATHGATWEIPVEPGDGLTYQTIVGTGLRRSAPVLAYFGDTAAAEPLFTADPTLADSPEALSQAAARGHAAFVRLLLRFQPDLARRVTVSRPRDMTELLFEQGMDPNRPNWLRITPLHRFAESDDLETAALFLAHGAAVDARDEEFRSTPLAWAARKGHARMVEFLLRHGAHPSLPDDPPWATPKAWASKRGHDAIVQLLEAFERSGTLPARLLARYEALAWDLEQAYGPGDPAALERIVHYFHAERAMGWDHPAHSVRVSRLRKAVRERLGTTSTERIQISLSLEDAQGLIARAEGFERWEELLANLRG